MSWTPDMMIYHHPCADGFGAAWAAWKRWGDAIQYVPANYGDAPPDVAGKHVLIGDFSYPKAVLEQMGAVARSIVILDHHRTAEADLREFTEFLADGPETIGLDLMAREDCKAPPIVARFDMEKSGARLMWDFCHPGAGVPMLIQYIEDRDLWRFDYAQTRAVALFLRAEPNDFGRWSEIADRLNDTAGTRSALLAEAQAMLRLYDQQVAAMAKDARHQWIGAFKVPVVNCTGPFASDVGHYLLDRFPDAAFVACYHDRADGQRSYSLRSTVDRVDVSEVARGFLGGGHRNAAGFAVKAPVWGEAA